MKILKESKSLSSSNFWNNLFVLFSTVFVLLGLPVFPEAEAIDVVTAVQSRQVSLIIVAVFTLGNSLFKIFKTYQVTGTLETVVKSRNFWTNFVTFVGGLLGAVLLGFPQEELIALKDAIFAGNLTAILVAAWNFINIIYHSYIKKKPDPEVNPTPQDN